MNRRAIIHQWIRTASLPRDMLLTILSTLAGWALAHYYFVKSLESTRADLAELRKLHQLTLVGIESIGTIHYARNPGGNVAGTNIEMRGSAPARATARATLQMHTSPDFAPDPFEGLV